MRVSLTLLAVAALFSASAPAQWTDVKTPGIPRLADGKPNLSAPAPRTADGKPDLTGIWQAGRAGRGRTIWLRLQRHPKPAGGRADSLGPDSTSTAGAGLQEGQPARALPARERPIP